MDWLLIGRLTDISVCIYKSGCVSLSVDTFLNVWTDLCASICRCIDWSMNVSDGFELQDACFRMLSSVLSWISFWFPFPFHFLSFRLLSAVLLSLSSLWFHLISSCLMCLDLIAFHFIWMPLTWLGLIGFDVIWFDSLSSVCLHYISLLLLSSSGFVIRIIFVAFLPSFSLLSVSVPFAPLLPFSFLFSSPLSAYVRLFNSFALTVSISSLYFDVLFWLNFVVFCHPFSFLTPSPFVVVEWDWMVSS
jgi:hypothetical protein